MPNNKISYGRGRNSAIHKEWRKSVKIRDEWKCKKCGTEKYLHAHHIIPWKNNELKRFDLDNGITLCRSCHKKEDGCKPAGWNKGLTRSKEWCKKLSESCKGRKVWNKGIKGIRFSQETEFKKGQIPWNKGISSIPDERSCKSCGINKNIKMFTPQQRGKFYSHICKDCRNNELKDKRWQRLQEIQLMKRRQA